MANFARYPALDGGKAFEFLTKAFDLEKRLSRETEALIQEAERKLDHDEITVVKGSKKPLAGS
jgi:hypothetical protein